MQYKDKLITLYNAQIMKCLAVFPSSWTEDYAVQQNIRENQNIIAKRQEAKQKSNTCSQTDTYIYRV